MDGFIDKAYKGQRVFIREEYEKHHKGMSEKERIEELLGSNYSELHDAIYDLLITDQRLLYHRFSWSLDDELREGQPLDEWLWEPYLDGFIHTVTAEYWPYPYRPNRDSNPCWSKQIDVIYQSTDKQVNNEMKDALLFTSLLAGLFKCKKK